MRERRRGPKKKGGPSPMSPSSKRKKIKITVRLQARKLIGWALPKNFMYNIYHHPQPPSKYIGEYKICKEVYLHSGEINLFFYSGIWDILGYINAEPR